MTSELLERYDADQRRVVDEYWDVMRFTRRTGKISDSIRKNEMAYWVRYPVDVVICALKIHTEKYPNHREQYTRGIIRNLAREKEAKYAKGNTGKLVGTRSLGQPEKRDDRAADAFRSQLR